MEDLISLCGDRLGMVSCSVFFYYREDEFLGEWCSSLDLLEDLERNENILGIILSLVDSNAFDEITYNTLINNREFHKFLQNFTLEIFNNLFSTCIMSYNGPTKILQIVLKHNKISKIKRLSKFLEFHERTLGIPEFSGVFEVRPESDITFNYLP